MAEAQVDADARDAGALLDIEVSWMHAGQAGRDPPLAGTEAVVVVFGEHGQLLGNRIFAADRCIDGVAPLL